MVTKAIIQGEKTENTYKVRIPIDDKLEGVRESNPDSVLKFATVCQTNGDIYDYKKGDIVWVDYDDGDKPVILGMLRKKKPTQGDLSLTTLEIKDYCKLPEETYIGKNVSTNELKTLVGVTGNIQKQLDGIYNQINNTIPINRTWVDTKKKIFGQTVWGINVHITNPTTIANFFRTPTTKIVGVTGYFNVNATLSIPLPYNDGSTIRQFYANNGSLVCQQVAGGFDCYVYFETIDEEGVL